MVIACVERAESLGSCLDSLRESCEEIPTELLVVSALSDSSVSEITSRYPGVRLITLDSKALVPQLWAEGIARSTGSVVALTISQCSAKRGWARAMVGAITGGAAAAGGPLTLHPDASNVDCAIFFLRYSAFLSDRSPSMMVGIAGDNCAYSSESLESGGWSREHGFWEVDVNDRLRNQGKKLEWLPEAAMDFRGAGSLSTIARRRYVHGRRFGVSRKVEHGESSLRIVLASPVVPFVLFARAARRAWSNKLYRRRLIASVPAFALLSASWAFGEAVGALGAGDANRS